MKRTTINENEVRTIIAVFKELESKGYQEMNKMLGSITIEEMVALRAKLDTWYQGKVHEKVYDEEIGWYNPHSIIF